MNALDHFNPVLLKELRQGMRQKGFWAPFGLSLLGSLTGAFVFFAQSKESPNRDYGREAFFVFFLALGLGLFFVAPYAAFRSLSRERDDESFVLLELTGLPMPKVVRGKFLNQLLQAALFSSAAAPFLLFSYYLNGLTLHVLAVSALATLSWSLFLTTFALFGAAMADSRALRVASHFIVLAVLLAGCFAAAACAQIILSEQQQLTRREPFFQSLLLVSALPLLWSWVLYEGTVERLTSPRVGYSARPRIALAVLVLAIPVALVGVFLTFGEQELLLLTMGATLSALHLFVFGVPYFTGRPELPRGGEAKSIFGAGNRRAFLFVLVLAVVAFSLLWAVMGDAKETSWRVLTPRDFHPLLVLPAYLIFYLSLPPALCHLRLFGGRLSAPLIQRLASPVVLALLGVVLPLVAAAGEIESNNPWLWLFNPLFATIGLHKPASDTWGPVLAFPEEAHTPLMLIIWGVALVTAALGYRALAREEAAARGAR